MFICLKQGSVEHNENLACEAGRDGEVKGTKKKEDNQKNVSSDMASAHQD